MVFLGLRLAGAAFDALHDFLETRELDLGVGAEAIKLVQLLLQRLVGAVAARRRGTLDFREAAGRHGNLLGARALRGDELAKMVLKLMAIRSYRLAGRLQDYVSPPRAPMPDLGGPAAVQGLSGVQRRVPDDQGCDEFQEEYGNGFHE